ncbi:MAG TPA: class I SAM-dependent methyltransferase [Methylomirabilota bacterium]|nr:class I SAM-dependent methyltransferase [Methylomirabilota bacterium]
MERVLEPELMTDPVQAEAYASADFGSVNQAFVDRFRALFPDLVRGRLVDLGCGPADIPIRLCQALPGVTVIGVDGSEAMLAPGRRAIAAAGLRSRIELVHARLPGLPRPPGGFDGVISNSLLHHVPEAGVFWAEVARLGRTGAAVLVVDLSRPDTRDRARAIVEAYAAADPDVLRRDFFHSLCAAFTTAEVAAQLATAGLTGLRVETISDRHWAAWGRL